MYSDFPPCLYDRAMKQGELVGNGSLIIGPTAEVISNLRGLQEVGDDDAVLDF